VAKTDNQDDLAYLRDLLAKRPKYTARFTEGGNYLDFSKMYEDCEAGNMYVKIDDDVVSCNAVVLIDTRWALTQKV
jgi:hypothetical protein